MYGPERNSFVFPRVLAFPRDEIKGNIKPRGERKLTNFPEDHTLSCLLYILDFPLNNHI